MSVCLCGLALPGRGSTENPAAVGLWTPLPLWPPPISFIDGWGWLLVLLSGSQPLFRGSLWGSLQGWLRCCAFPVPCIPHSVFSLGPETEKLVLEAGNGLPSWKFNDQLFPCDVCGKVFGRQQTLSRHLSLHTGEWGPQLQSLPLALPGLFASKRLNFSKRITTGSGGMLADSDLYRPSCLAQVNETLEKLFYTEKTRWIPRGTNEKRRV